MPQESDEIDFWQLRGTRQFRALGRGKLLLHKLHGLHEFIVGRAFFDLGYGTIMAGHCFRLSHRLEDDYGNSESFDMHDSQKTRLSRSIDERLRREYLDWRGETVFRS